MMSAGTSFRSLFRCRRSRLEILNERSKHLMNRFSTLSKKKVSNSKLKHNIYGTISEGGEGIEEGQYAMVSYRSNRIVSIMWI